MDWPRTLEIRINGQTVYPPQHEETTERLSREMSPSKGRMDVSQYVRPGTNTLGLVHLQGSCCAITGSGEGGTVLPIETLPA